MCDHAWSKPAHAYIRNPCAPISSHPLQWSATGKLITWFNYINIHNAAAKRLLICCYWSIYRLNVLGGGVPIKDPLSFIFFIFQTWSQLIKNTPICGGHVCRLTDVHQLIPPIKHRRVGLREAEVGSEQTQTDHVISVKQLPIPRQNIHDPRSAWM